MCSNPGRRGGKPATNRLSYGTAYEVVTDVEYPTALVKEKPRTQDVVRFEIDLSDE
jgi:hypothetical protein